MNPTLSIIVPVYNVEDYLTQCIESVLNQKYQDFELILVNDGSSDSSGDICNQYANNDSRVTVKHKDNGGQSSARNVGLDIAKGKYIGFVDSDDWIHYEMYERLIKHALIHQSDIVACNFQVMKKDGSFEPYTKYAEDKEYNRKEAMAEIFKNEVLTFSPCNKIYRSQLFDKVRFIEGIILEDKDISYKLIDVSNKVSYIKDSLYFYRYNAGSTLRSAFSFRRLDEFKVQLDMYNYYKHKYKEVADLVYYDVFDIGSYLYSQIKKSGEDSVDIREYNYLIEFKFDILTRLIKNKQISIIKRLKLLITIISPKLWIFLRILKDNFVQL
ncbi:glycosyltransferase family 2 protein [Alkalibacter saccharofermentans]|uniref:Glycosyl transferase family 2 n=1 Tax=Alkalibacter saccharofermentans DSM 14828 TaxID=1120975 RepID=A0A1M4WPV2_9FIRM|nr:glycosyltransferase [Alkalibacter saccharofermentans]SHE83266.1 Glycosyl transferase family 2 [Alkalibacter saccharofermentans DSM 14828]